jgi:uncharacterized membrane protein HdeD (DUF308 family)
MKYKQKVDCVIDVLLLIAGIILLINGIFNNDNVKYIFIFMMSFYAILNLIKFLLTKESKDYEGLYTVIGSLALIILTIISYKDNNISIALLVLGWTTIMSIIKYIKADYYNDHRDRMWKIRIFTLIIFMINGIICTFALLESSDKILILGYFFFINGILEFIDPFTKYLINN